MTVHGFDLYVNGRTIARRMSRSVCLRTLLSDCNASPLDFVDDAVVLHAAGAPQEGFGMMDKNVDAESQRSPLTELLA